MNRFKAKPIAVVWVSVFLSACLVSGCVSTQDIRREEAVTQQAEQVQSLWKYDMEQLSSRMDQLQSSVQSLETRMASLSQDFQTQLQHEQQVTERLTQMEKSVNDLQVSARSQSIDTLLSRVGVLLKQQQYDQIVELLQPSINRVDPTDQGHDELLYSFAKSLYETQAYEQATVVAADIEVYHTQSSRLPDALLLQAQALEKLDRRQDAQVFYDDLNKRFPKSSAARIVRKQRATNAKKSTKKK